MGKRIKILEIIKLGGVPGYILLGYYAVMLAISRSRASMTAVDSSAIISALYSLGGGLYSYMYLVRRRERKIFLSRIIRETPLKWFVLYTMVCGLSSLWSVNLAISAYRTLECFGILFLMLATIETLFEKTDTNGVLVWGAIYASITVAIKFFAFFPPLGDALYSCQMPATIFFYLALFYAPNWYTKWPLMIIALFCRSTTGYIGMALGLFSLMLGKTKYKILGGVIAVIVIITTSFIGFDNLLNKTIFAAKQGVIENGEFNMSKTSGRDVLWENAINLMEEENRQLYGFGFVSGEMFLVRELIGNQVIGMHNGYLSAYVGTGLFGLFFFTLFMLTYAIIPFGRFIPSRYKQILVALMCAVMVHTFANPGLGTRVYATWIPAMFVVVITCAIYIRSKFKIER